MNIKKSTVAIVVLVALLVPSLYRNYCTYEPEADWLVRPSDPNRLPIWEAYAVSSALSLFAEKNGGRLPASIDQLKPDYVGASIDLSQYYLARPGATIRGKYEEIVTRKILTSEGERIVCIFGNGQVSVTRPGD
ncbi:MAG: hypothetical protein ABSA45_03955 [Verrucomicrobiota bacterium]|jgi:hypothetical protein